MGDIGNAAAGAMNAAATMYSAERNYDAQIKTNESNEFIHQSDNQFNAGEALKNRQFQTGERIASQDFNAAQADLNRQFQSSEADKARQFQIDSIGKAAAEYQKLGINPAGTVQGVPSGGSSPAGSAASSSPSSGSAASAAPFGGLTAPRFDGNPISAFIEAFQSSQMTQSQVNAQKLKNKFQEVENKFQVREKLLGLRQRNAQLQKDLADADTSRATKSKLETEKRYNDLQIDVYEHSLQDFKAMNHEQRVQAQLNTKMLAEKYVQEQINTEWLPMLLSSQYNLTEAQAQSCVQMAAAALKQAVTAEYNSKTGRMQLDFDKAKWNGTIHRLVNAQINTENQKKNTLEAEENFAVRNTKAVSEKQFYDILSSGMNMVTKSLSGAAALLGGSLVVKGAAGAANAGSINAYLNSPSTTFSK